MLIQCAGQEIKETKNEHLLNSFIEETINYIKNSTAKIQYNIYLTLFEICFNKTKKMFDLFDLYQKNQHKIHYPSEINIKKYDTIFLELNNEKEILKFIDSGEKEEKQKIIECYYIFKESFYRRFDKKKYETFICDPNFIKAIIKQVDSGIKIGRASCRERV